jgi:hypothetical protein
MMGDTGQHDGANNSETSAARRRLTDSEQRAGGFKPVTAYVPDDRFGKAPPAPNSPAARKAEERRQLKVQGRGQLNVITSLDEKKRGAVKAVAEAVMNEEDSPGSIATAVMAVVKSPELKQLLLSASADPEIQELLNVVVASAARTKSNCSASEEDLIQILTEVAQLRDPTGGGNGVSLDGAGIAISLMTDSELHECMHAMVADPALKVLVLAVCREPALRTALEAAEFNRDIAVISARLRNSAPELVSDVAVALEHPEAIAQAKFAATSKAILEGFRFVIRYPETAEAAHRLLAARGLWAWLARKLMGA